MSPFASVRGTHPQGTEPLMTGIAREPGPLADLAAEWELVRSASPTASPFLSHAWQAAWWADLGSADARRRLLVVTARADGGRLLGVLPLFVEPVGLGGAGGRVGRLLGTGSAAPDHLDAIVDRRDPWDTLRTLLDVVGSPAEALDAVAFTDLDEGASLRRATARWAMDAGLAWRERVAERCPWLPLDGTYGTYVANLAAKHRYKLRRFDRKLQEAGRVDLEIAETPDEVRRSLEEVFRLHALRWTARRARSSFDTPAVRAFHRRMA
ncbi:MAG TPA: GNAT family N-acetyltransferase, partial [Candidatus Binatus sp.]|nr:GNAT family N-acetyltransferase [Candidatus Binatus sp.]